MADYRCPDCNSFEIWDFDAPGFEDASAEMIAAHEATHQFQLEHHDGDVEKMQMQLQNPSLFAATYGAE
jgi:hypothetical protein